MLTLTLPLRSNTSSTLRSNTLDVDLLLTLPLTLTLTVEAWKIPERETPGGYPPPSLSPYPASGVTYLFD